MAVVEAMPMFLWRKYVLKSQVYSINIDTSQYNHSSMLLHNNGGYSSGNRTRHINIRYFFVVEIFKSAEVKIKYFSTDYMI